MAAIAARDGANPLFELETGRMTEAEFLQTLGARADRSSSGGRWSCTGSASGTSSNLHPNEPMIEYMRELRGRGYKMAICTNNVREWEPLWRAKLPVDEIFDVVVDSGVRRHAQAGARIYEITLERLGVAAAGGAVHRRHRGQLRTPRASSDCRPCWFRSTEQAIAEIEASKRDRGL